MLFVIKIPVNKLTITLGVPARQKYFWYVQLPTDFVDYTPFQGTVQWVRGEIPVVFWNREPNSPRRKLLPVPV
jgi:hypothetical protein